MTAFSPGDKVVYAAEPLLYGELVVVDAKHEQSIVTQDFGGETDKFSADELVLVDDFVDRAAESVDSWLQGGTT